jgi:hypothetical protein
MSVSVRYVSLEQTHTRASFLAIFSLDAKSAFPSCPAAPVETSSSSSPSSSSSTDPSALVSEVRGRLAGGESDKGADGIVVSVAEDEGAGRLFVFAATVAVEGPAMGAVRDARVGAILYR